MTSHPTMTRRRFIVPEVVQTSAMDCGPAALTCLLEGFGISVSYGRLREACQTDVDGTSIDTLESVAGALGLDAEQIMIPADHLLIPEANALPAIAVVRLPNGLTHFVVIWRRLANHVQIMDPATGRQWMTTSQLLSDLYLHRVAVPPSAFREWAGSNEASATLRSRISELGIAGADCTRLIESALSDATWRSLAALDAATRMVRSLVRADGIKRGREALRILERSFDRARTGPLDEAESVPATYWTVRPAPADPSGDEQLWLRGAVLVRIRGRKSTAEPATTEEAANSNGEPSLASARPPDLVAALNAPPSRPWLDLFRILRADGLYPVVVLAAAVLIAAVGVVAEALLFRGLLDLQRDLNLVGQRVGAMMALSIFLAAALALQLGIATIALRSGRHLEVRLRAAFLMKIPRLGDRYFQSRLISDMAERSHSLYQLRLLPIMGEELLRWLSTLVFTTAGIIWLDPKSAPLAIVAALVLAGNPLCAQVVLTERDLRVRTHTGALGRFYLDALLGLVAARAHGAEQAIRREQEGLLVEWFRAGASRLRVFVTVSVTNTALGYAFAALLLFGHLGRGGDPSRVLLLAYWVLSLPAIGQELANLAREYPNHRNVALRALEPLGAPEDATARRGDEVSTIPPPENDGLAPDGAVDIRLEGVSIRAAGHTIIEDLHLAVAPGSHVAIVGPSGAGKSSLVGLLLGWHRAASGHVLIDGALLDNRRLETLRQQIAWVDPAAQIWNRSMLDNVCYGVTEATTQTIGRALEDADLLGVVEKLPEGLKTPLGEGGGLVSGGEGQRVRLGRAMLRPNVRLAILDEPFRGLDRPKRRELLGRARTLWKGVTMLCVTHDVGETLDFDRVLVIEGGRLVEDGAPADLAGQPASRYRAMLDAETDVRKGEWANAVWRRVRLEDGRLTEEQASDEVPS